MLVFQCSVSVKKLLDEFDCFGLPYAWAAMHEPHERLRIVFFVGLLLEFLADALADFLQHLELSLLVERFSILLLSLASALYEAANVLGAVLPANS